MLKILPCISQPLVFWVFLSLKLSENEESVSTLLFLNSEACRKLVKLSPDISNQEAFQHPTILHFKNELLKKLLKKASGSSTTIVNAIIAINSFSINLGEITDKGALNQKAILKYREDFVEQMYQ